MRAAVLQIDLRPSPSTSGTRGVWALLAVASYSRFLAPVLGFQPRLTEYRAALSVLVFVQSPVPVEYRTVLAVLENALFWKRVERAAASTGGMEYRTVLAVLAARAEKSE